jgi:transposase
MKSKKLALTPEEFVEIYYEHYAAGLTLTDLASSVGLPYATTAGRVSRYKKRGVKLPALRSERGNGCGNRLDARKLNAILAKLQSSPQGVERWQPTANGVPALSR